MGIYSRELIHTNPCFLIPGKVNAKKNTIGLKEASEKNASVDPQTQTQIHPVLILRVTLQVVTEKGHFRHPV